MKRLNLILIPIVFLFTGCNISIDESKANINAIDFEKACVDAGGEIIVNSYTLNTNGNDSVNLKCKGADLSVKIKITESGEVAISN